MLGHMNRLYSDSRNPEYIYNNHAIVSFGSPDVDRTIDGGVAVGREFGDGYAGDIGISFWWKPTQWSSGPGPTYGIFSWGGVIHMHVLGGKIIVRITDNGAASPVELFANMTPTTVEYGGAFDLWKVWHHVVINFTLGSPSTFSVSMKNNTGDDLAFANTGSMPTGDMDFTTANLDIGCDKDSGKNPISNSKLADFNIFNDPITDEARMYMMGGWYASGGGPFKRKMFACTSDLGITGTSTSYGGMQVSGAYDGDIELYNVNHKCRLIASTPDPTDNGNSRRPSTYIADERKWRMDIGLKANQWKSPQNEVSNTRADIMTGRLPLANGDSLVAGTWYIIDLAGTLDFTTSGAPSSTKGVVFCATNTNTLGANDQVKAVHYSWIPKGNNKMYISTLSDGFNYMTVENVNNAEGAAISMGNSTEFNDTVDIGKSYKINIRAHTSLDANIVVKSAVIDQTHGLIRGSELFEFYIHADGTNDTISFSGLAVGEKIYLRECTIELLPVNGAIDLSGNSILIEQWGDTNAQELSLGVQY